MTLRSVLLLEPLALEPDHRPSMHVERDVHERVDPGRAFAEMLRDPGQLDMDEGRRGAQSAGAERIDDAMRQRHDAHPREPSQGRYAAPYARRGRWPQGKLGSRWLEARRRPPPREPGGAETRPGRNGSAPPREEAGDAHGERLLHDQPDDLAIGRANELQGGDGFLLVERQRVDDKGDDYRRHDEQEPRKEADLPARAFDDRTAENHLLLRLSEGGEMLPPPDLPGVVFGSHVSSADERARH